MSAYVVEDSVLHFLLTFMLNRRGSVYVPSTSQRVPCTLDTYDHETRKTGLDWLGTVLLFQNHRSVNERYRQRDVAPAYRWKEHRATHTLQPLPLAIQVLKACACYDYQACETDDYERTDAAHIIRDIRAEAIRSLPGYDAAEWGAPDMPTSGPTSIMVLMSGRA